MAVEPGADIEQVSFWIADSFNLNTFVIASSMISAGLTWWQACRVTLLNGVEAHLSGIPVCHYRLFTRRTHSGTQRSTRCCSWLDLPIRQPNHLRIVRIAMAGL